MPQDDSNYLFLNCRHFAGDHVQLHLNLSNRPKLLTDMINILIPLIGILATIFAVSSTVPQIVKGMKTRKMDDVSVLLIMALIVGLSLWVVYGIAKNDIVIVGGNSVGVSLNAILLLLKIKYSREPISQIYKNGFSVMHFIGN